MTRPRILTLAASTVLAAVLATGCSTNTPADTIPGDHPPASPIQVVASPTDSPAPPVADSPAPVDSPAPADSPDPPPADPVPPAQPDTAQTIHGVHPGAFCSQHDQFGLTSAGTLMQCTTTATDSRYRWRKA